MNEIRSTSDIRRLQKEAKEQELPSVHIRDFDKVDCELQQAQQALARMAKAVARAMKRGQLGRMSPFYEASYFQGFDETWPGDDEDTK
jgi:hypothetical protein